MGFCLGTFWLWIFWLWLWLWIFWFWVFWLWLWLWILGAGALVLDPLQALDIWPWAFGFGSLDLDLWCWVFNLGSLVWGPSWSDGLGGTWGRTWRHTHLHNDANSNEPLFLFIYEHVCCSYVGKDIGSYWLIASPSFVFAFRRWLNVSELHNQKLRTALAPISLSELDEKLNSKTPRKELRCPWKSKALTM